MLSTLKIRLQGDSEEEVDALREALLEQHPGLCLGAPREGRNPKYADNQKWASYGDLIVEIGPRGGVREKARRRRKRCP